MVSGTTTAIIITVPIQQGTPAIHRCVLISLAMGLCGNLSLRAFVTSCHSL
jgi:hypothetical protein